MPYIGSMVIISILSLIAILVNPEMFEYYDAFNIKTLVGNIFMLQDYPVLSLADKYIGSSISITSFASARPFWTLAIEWWLFLFFGFFYLYLIRVERIRLFEWFIFGFLAIVPMYNLLSGRGNCLTLVWLGGAAVNILYKKIEVKSLLLKKILVVVSFLVLLADGLLIKNAYSRSFQIMVLLSLFWMLVLFKDSKKTVADTKGAHIVRLVSSYSYSLYLLHYSLIRLIIILPMNISVYAKAVMAIAASNIAAYIFAVVFERKESLIVGICTKKVNKFLKVY